MEDLQVEYVRLFDYGAQYPPYESSHRTDIERNHSLQALSKFYRKPGVECSASFDPDHISVELEFMRFLAHLEGGPSESGNGRKEVCLQYEKGFMENHLSRWLPDFCRCLHEKTDVPFFSALASLTKAFILEDSDYINALFKDPQ